MKIGLPGANRADLNSDKEVGVERKVEKQNDAKCR